MRKPISLLLFVLSLPALAQTPYLVKDINAITNASPAPSDPANFIRFGSRVFFTVDHDYQSELWSTDGTEAGTSMVAAIVSQATSANPSRFIVVNGKLLFNATDLSHGEELWASDGTAAGTKLLADISPGAGYSSPGSRIVYHGQMIFDAADGVDGRELWITDGTPAGTKLFKDLVPGLGSSNPHSFVVFNDLVYFGAGEDLWKTDGTEGGTVKVKSSVNVQNLVVAGTRMFFTGNTSQTGAEPWVSDGTEAGTHLITELVPGTANGMLSAGTPFGDRIVFQAADPDHGRELWISDGTAAGTHILRDINPGPAESILGDPYITVADGVAYFSAFSPAEGQELWRTDGTEAGTTLVRDIYPGMQGNLVNRSNPAGLVAVGDRIFFSARNGGSTTLWTSDGTAAGTRQVKTSSPLAVFIGFTNIDGTLYFGGANNLNGVEPWKSDGTDAGTSMLANIQEESGPSSYPAILPAADDWIYFSAWDGIGSIANNGEPRSLWRSDGTAEGTVRLLDATGTEGFFAAGRSIFFGKGGELWTSDGSPEGTVPAAELASRFPGPLLIAYADGDKLFANVLSSSPPTLWVTTLASHAPATLLTPFGAGLFVNVAGRLMFFAGDSFYGLWTTDGTPAGTYAVVPNVGTSLSGAVAFGGYLYFSAMTSAGTKLWKSDGSFEGTTVVRTFPSGSLGLRNFVVAGKNLFFLSDSQVWITDGTDAGTRVLSPKTTGVLAPEGDRVIFFAAVSSQSGAELWASDGTVEGTHILHKFAGVAPSTADELVGVNGAVYFRAYDPVNGSELWVTDGTSEGTRLVADIEPGANSSYPHELVRAGNRLFFIGGTTDTGVELWSLNTSSPLRLSMNDVRVAEGDSGTKTARFTVSLSAPSTQTVTVDYATSDGTAVAGSDYDAASGTLTFAPGETTKNVDVRVRGDVVPENNETFALTLRNASGAALPANSAFAIIDDDDQSADMALALDFSFWDNLDVLVNATNNGPRTATNMKILHTATPADIAASSCQLCPSPPQVMASGATARAYDYRWFSYQQYLTATAVIHERDPQPANNSVGWVTNIYLAMDALYLTPGSQANVWFEPSQSQASVTITSSDPSVISVPSSLTAIAAKPVSFIARGVSVGTATIRVSTPAATLATLTIDVVNPGTKLRWPGGVTAAASNGAASFDTQMGFAINASGTAPYTGERATGVVTVSANGRELGRLTLAPGPQLQVLPFYLPALGVNAIRFDYLGDANFLPMTQTSNITATIGHATILGGAERNGTTAKIHLRVTGSPEGTPTGTLRISEAGVIAPIDIPLTAATPGTAQADIALSNVSAAPHTLVVTYSGDGHYSPSTQNVRITEGHNRAVRR